MGEDEEAKMRGDIKMETAGNDDGADGGNGSRGPNSNRQAKKRLTIEEF